MLDLAAGVPFCSLDPPVRRLTYATNSAASLKLFIHTKSKSKGSFPTEVAKTKLIYFTIKT